jgi:hypothetical protein
VFQNATLGTRFATGDKPGIVVVEVPEKPQWCEIRNTVFSWTRTRFPFHTSSAKKLNVTDPPVITVIGKAFFDISHAPKDQSNRRKYRAGYAAWEIRPGDEMVRNEACGRSHGLRKSRTEDNHH